jgi:hypothetical protein
MPPHQPDALKARRGIEPREIQMKLPLRSLLLPTAVLLTGLSAALAQGTSPPPPDPTHITFTHMADFKWEGDPKSGQVHVNLLGDPSKPGLYIRLAKWLPHHFSHPHMHDKIRHFMVVSGTWWVSSGTTYDPSKTYPMTAGTFVTDLPNKSHFDGAKDEPGVILEIGFGPLKSKSCTPTTC